MADLVAARQLRYNNGSPIQSRSWMADQQLVRFLPCVPGNVPPAASGCQLRCRLSGLAVCLSGGLAGVETSAIRR